MGPSHSVVDAWVKGLVDAHGERLARLEDRRPSAAFALLCARTLLDRGDHEVLPFLTEGADDCGVDIFFVHGRDDGEFTLPVTIFSAKYGTAEKRERQAFPKTEIGKLIDLVRRAFDPGATLPANETLATWVAEVHSHLLEGYVPAIRVVACSMGRPWDANAQTDIDDADLPGVSWDHLGPDELMALRRGSAPVDAKLQLVGPVMREGFGFHTSLVGRMRARDVADLVATHGEAMIDRNVRRYLGARNRVNRDIAATLRNPTERKHLFFLNNGLTFACTKLRHNQIQAENHVVRADGLQLVNGAQTAYTIRHVLSQLDDVGDASVLVRLYEIAEEEDPDLIARITRATNSQTPVDLRDLRANDPIQRDLEVGMAELGWTYLRKRSVNGASSEKSVTPTEAAAAILAVIRRQPHLARFESNQHFGALYDRIFKRDLKAEWVSSAVDLVRQADHAADARHRKWAGRLLHYGRFHLALAISDSSSEPIAAIDRFMLSFLRTGLTPRDSLARQSAVFRRPDLLASIEVLGSDREAVHGRYPESISNPAEWAMANAGRLTHYERELLIWCPPEAQ